jgi:hypothetical protein
MAQPLAPLVVPAHERWIRIDENLTDGYIGSGTYGKVSESKRIFWRVALFFYNLSLVFNFLK